MDIFVAKLGYDISENQLREAFSAYGEVTSVKIIMDKFTGRSKCFGFLEMPNQSEAERAIKELNRSIMDSQVIQVSEARPKPADSHYSSAISYPKDKI